MESEPIELNPLYLPTQLVEWLGWLAGMLINHWVVVHQLKEWEK
jgi:hypothetical protein